MRSEKGRSWCWIALALLYMEGVVVAEDPYRYFDWRITYGDIHPLGVRQQVFSRHTKY